MDRATGPLTGYQVEYLDAIAGASRFHDLPPVFPRLGSPQPLVHGMPFRVVPHSSPESLVGPAGIVPPDLLFRPRGIYGWEVAGQLFLRLQLLSGSSHVGPFVRISLVIVEFLFTIPISNITITCIADRVIALPIGGQDRPATFGRATGEN
jgi:hypothetical protein